MPRSGLEQLSRELTDKGRLVEAGWIGLRIAAFPPDMPAEQLAQMRNVFFAGAHHLFACIIAILDPGEEPTEVDLVRMDQINAELKAFIADYAAKNLPTKGTA